MKFSEEWHWLSATAIDVTSNFCRLEGRRSGVAAPARCADGFSAIELNRLCRFYGRGLPKEVRGCDEQTAYAVPAWLQCADRSGLLVRFLSPSLTADEYGIARIEGRILVVV